MLQLGAKAFGGGMFRKYKAKEKPQEVKVKVRIKFKNMVP